MNKKNLILLIFTLSFFLVGCTFTGKVSDKDERNPVEEIQMEEEEISEYNRSGEGVYSITGVEAYPCGNHMSIKFTVQNINVEPFITNIGTDSCIFSDSKGNTYTASYMGEYRFEKALIKGEEAQVTINCGQLGIHVYDETHEVVCGDTKDSNWSNSITKCKFDGDGNCVCEEIGPLRPESCLFRINNDGNQASAGWGKYPLNMNIKK